jgi:hypothetical protein
MPYGPKNWADDKNYDTKVSVTNTEYDGDGFCGFTSKNYPEIIVVSLYWRLNIINLRVIFRGNTTKTITIIVSLYW